MFQLEPWRDLLVCTYPVGLERISVLSHVGARIAIT